MMHTRCIIPKPVESGKILVLFFETESPFCSFHPAEFTVNVNEKMEDRGEDKEKIIKFSCSEQYFMYKKALLVHDNTSANKILHHVNPMAMKMLGRQLNMTREDIDKWTRKSRDVMYRACLEKFAQNERLRLFLFRTHGMTLVEASPTDKIWGIGRDIDDPRAENRDTWQGTNWLGEVLDGVREELWQRTEFSFDREKVLTESLEKRCELLEQFKYLK